jgi:hypothetical protein
LLAPDLLLGFLFKLLHFLFLLELLLAFHFDIFLLFFMYFFGLGNRLLLVLANEVSDDLPPLGSACWELDNCEC